MNGVSGSYYDYSSLFANTSTSAGSTNMYDIIQAYNNSSKSSYGANSSALTSTQAQNVIGFKNAAADILSTISKIASTNNDGSSIFGAYKATSSNAEILGVSYKSDVDKYSSEALAARRDPNYEASTPENFAIKTLQLATTQKNTSALKASDMALESGKTYRFEISDGDTTKSYSFVTESGDDNESIHNKIAAAINADKNSAVKATVSYSQDTGQSYLTLESKETGLKAGENKAFEIRDVAGYDAISKLGADKVTQNAQNAEYLIGVLDMSKSTKDTAIFKDEPVLKTSRTNEIAVDDRTTVTLKKTSEDFVAIEYENDSLQGINAARELVNGYNALFELASENTGNSRSTLLLNQLSGLAQTYSSSLSEIGITRDEKGYLTIDEDKMQYAAENGKLENFFESDSDSMTYGFTNRLSQIAKSVNDNPTQYVGDSKKAESGDSNAANFWNDFNSGSSNYSRLYFNMQKYENIGVLFNSMF